MSTRKVKNREYLILKMKDRPDLLDAVEAYAAQEGIPVHTAVKSLLKRGLDTVGVTI